MISINDPFKCLTPIFCCVISFNIFLNILYYLISLMFRVWNKVTDKAIAIVTYAKKITLLYVKGFSLLK